MKKNNRLSKKTQVVRNKTNSGFAKAVNIGLKKALNNKDIYAVLLLNSDVYFTKDLLENGVNILEKHPTAGAVVPKILYSDNRI